MDPAKYREKLSKYGLTHSQYNELRVAHNDLCAICGNPETKKTPQGADRSLAIDHCHSTGVVRGLLCNDCNLKLGWLKDDTEWMASAIRYLDEPPALCINRRDGQVKAQ